MSRLGNETFYQRYGKRAIDLCLSLILLILFWWVLAIVALLVRFKLGSPVLFRQPRPGKDEKIFNLYKFRSMTDERDENGNLLPDEMRLTKFGKALRATSLDELPEVFNIVLGEMAIIGPRPQLVRDMVFMTPEQRRRHCVRPGLSGLAQVNGRNAIAWDDKLAYDLDYIEHITFAGDVAIFFKTLAKAFVKQEGITEDGMATAADYGDYLLAMKHVTREKYDDLQAQAKKLLDETVVIL
ncbi:sugar transferase [Collinsella aerofaciens]|uniref:Undecaprenyl phosphate N,N'-diacetylbacillosamine 1-phosphate transferase n=1 Tax=Collinsella aerofaciens TaxID=74426 RepID=A0A5K1J371_9ACTN|nr:sugar transferase [Collinsella aerofaciens]VWL96933.1 Undecaprenyl phosphate N,N'-diacetylbacillosamine 1-phosphate transferase [Collinsella aerofaciens]